jgi:hypothetical protein
MCTACQKSISGFMKKRKTARRRSSRVSGLNVKSAFSGLTNIKTLGVAGATVFGLKTIAENAKGEEMAMLRSKQGGMIEAGAGLAGLFLFKNPLMRGIALGVAVDGAKKYFTGKDWNGGVLAETNDAVAGYSWLPGAGPSVRQPFYQSANGGGVRYGR